MKSVFLLFTISLLLACGGEPKVKLKPLDMTSYGLPLKIMVPDSAEIIKKEYSIMRDITIRKGDWYFVQIFESQATTPHPAEVKRSQLEAAKQDKYFKELIQEDEDGFIYRKQLDNDMVDFDFRYIKILGNKEVIFQTGLIGTFTIDQVRLMYKSVRNKK